MWLFCFKAKVPGAITCSDCVTDLVTDFNPGTRYVPGSDPGSSGFNGAIVIIWAAWQYIDDYFGCMAPLLLPLCVYLHVYMVHIITTFLFLHLMCVAYNVQIVLEGGFQVGLFWS